MSKLNQLRARLGSIAPSRMATFPLSVRRLLEEDFPALIGIVEAAQAAASEEPVREMLCAYVMGCELMKRIEEWEC